MYATVEKYVTDNEAGDMGCKTNLRSRSGQPGETEELIPYDFTVKMIFNVCWQYSSFLYMYVHLKYDK